MRKNILLTILLAICCQAYCQKQIKMLQFNIWQEGTVVEGGFEGIVSNILSLNPDIVTFSEVRNYNKVIFIPKLVKELNRHGVKYYGLESVSTGIISKYQIDKQEVVYPLNKDRGSVLKACIAVDNIKIAVYSAHLDWLNCSSYLPRGYDGCTWKELPNAIVDAKKVIKDNKESFRPAEIKALIDDAKKEITNGYTILIGGDFNEPSFLDWDKRTKDIREHKGLVIKWDCSCMLYKSGYIDAYRKIYPDVIKYPGFTFPADNEAVKLEKLTWAAKSDERERIDFIYYRPTKQIRLKDISIVGPEGIIYKGMRLKKDSESNDNIIPPKGVWPTDHKALIATFNLY